MTGPYWPWLATLLVPLMWAYMNHYYGRVYGRSLRWWYFWAAHGALLFGKRFPEWEQRATGRRGQP